MSDTQSNTQNQNPPSPSRPSHVVKTRTGYGDKARFIRLGVAYEREGKEGLYVRLTGKQVIDDGFYLFPIEENQAGAAQ